MEALTIRPATEADVERIAEVVQGDPGQETIGIVGNKRAARRFGMAIARVSFGKRGGWRQTTVAEVEGRIVGVVEAGKREWDVPIGLPEVLAALRSLGPLGVLRMLPRLRASDRIRAPSPPDAYHIAELDVDPAWRGKGIGGLLLDHAETAARDGGYTQMSLSTTTVNPARRLYERHGFVVAETRTDPDYERWTGIEGRHLMLKDLT